MSHFSTIVLLPSGTKNITDAVSDLLAPFDENEEAEPYRKDVVDLDKIEEHYKCDVSKMPPAQIVEKLNDWNGQSNIYDTQSNSYYYLSTYNPESKWDWWVIGGRWTGAFKPEYDPTTDSANLKTCFICKGSGKRSDSPCNGCDGSGRSVKHAPEWKDVGNVESVSNLLSLDKEQFEKIAVPFAVVTPQGEWGEQGEMGWFGISTDNKPKDEWSDQVRAIYEKHKDCIAVMCDLHI